MCANALCPVTVLSRELFLQTLAVERHPDQAWQAVADLQRAGFDAELAAKAKPRQPKQVGCALQQQSKGRNLLASKLAFQQLVHGASWNSWQLPLPLHLDSVHQSGVAGCRLLPHPRHLLLELLLHQSAHLPVGPMCPAHRQLSGATIV